MMPETKSEKICFRVTPAQREKLESVAASWGISLSSFLGVVTSHCDNFILDFPKKRKFDMRSLK